MKEENKKKSNVPNLRFPEFEGEWKKKKLGDIANITGGGTPNTDIEEYWNGEIHWFTPSEIKSAYVDKSVRTITELGLVKSSAKLLPAGAILLTTRATIGEVAIAQKECCTNQGFQSLVVNDGINNIFIANWIKQNKNELTKRAKGSTFAEISKSEVEKIPLVIPNTDEQNKIAKFLTLLDERIATQNKIIEDLKLLKNTISKQILRNSNWKKYRIREIGELGRGRVISTSEIKSQHNPKYPVYSSQTLNNGIMGYLDTYDFEGEYLTWTTDGANAGTVFYRQGKFNCTNVCGTIKVNSWNNPYFVAHCLQLETKRYVSTDLANPKLMNNTMASIELHLPDIKTQNFISHLFISLDKKYEVENKIYIRYINAKKYLLFNLFI